MSFALEQELTGRLDSPVVFAHNDLLSGNLMFNDEEGICFISSPVSALQFFPLFCRPKFSTILKYISVLFCAACLTLRYCKKILLHEKVITASFHLI